MNLVPIILGFSGLLAAYLLYAQVKKYPAGEKNLTDISDEIHLGAMAFMKKEYSILFVFSLILVFGIYIGLGLDSTIAFIVGALSSSITGFIGMYTATKANVRTATAAQNVKRLTTQPDAYDPETRYITGYQKRGNRIRVASKKTTDQVNLKAEAAKIKSDLGK